jgi:hypothetical protein
MLFILYDAIKMHIRWYFNLNLIGGLVLWLLTIDFD